MKPPILVRHEPPVILFVCAYPITGVKNGNDHEKQSILGMVMRLGIFARDWVSQIFCIFDIHLIGLTARGTQWFLQRL
jgi:hypothetical protein